MSNQIEAWGKLKEQGESHPLTAHMLDVAACFHTVAKIENVRRALARLAGRALTDVDLMRLSALAFLHDVGKANAGFQAKRWKSLAQPVPSGWPPAAGHVSEALYIFGEEKLLLQLPVNEMDTWGPACWSLWRASISHHGRQVRRQAHDCHLRASTPQFRLLIFAHDRPLHLCYAQRAQSLHRA